jgi:2-amino-4-hydroxy-6-hydroxymethyldihydropteridine diphosphokinase
MAGNLSGCDALADRVNTRPRTLGLNGFMNCGGLRRQSSRCRSQGGYLRYTAKEVALDPILIALGANLPGPHGEMPIATLRAAIEALRGLPGLRLHSVSRWWRTAPIPPSGQPDYINGVARLEGEAEPAALLARLQAIEAAAGRPPRSAGRVVNAARCLDLDIIAIGSRQRAAPDPILPHPRAHQRVFVLAPLADVAPGWVHPVLGVTVEALLQGLRDQQAAPI